MAEPHTEDREDAGAGWASIDNRFARIARRCEWLPGPLRRRAMSYAVGRAIPFVGAARLAVETLEAERVAVRLTNRRRVQNHLGGLHAGAMALVAETASGLVVAMNVPADGAPVLRAMEVSFERPARGTLRAEATLTEAEAARIRTRPLGKIDVPVRLTDAAGEAPLTCHMHWAWLPRRRLPDL